MEITQLEITHIPLSELKADDNNPNYMTKRQKDQLTASITEYGFLQPLVVTHDHQIVNGNQKYLAVMENDDLLQKYQKLPCCILPENATDNDILLVQQALNKIHGEDDTQRDANIFAKLLASSSASTTLQSLLGSTDASISNLIRAATNNSTDAVQNKVKKAQKAISDLKSTTRCHTGETWQIKDHTITIGDCTDIDVWPNTTNDPADLTFTSPPYNTRNKPRTSIGGSLKHTNKDQDKHIDMYGTAIEINDMLDWPSFLDKLTTNAITRSKYLFLNLQMTASNRIPYIEYMYRHRNNYVDKIIWYKKTSVPIGHNVMSNVYEDILIFTNIDKPNRTIDTMAEKQMNNVYTCVPTAHKPSDEVGGKILHAATFPVELPVHIISNFTRVGGHVFDPCVGTGTTLIACEQLGRVGHGIEIIPTYAEYAIRRLEDITGQKAVKMAETGHDQS